jgi:hypothetical protein
MQCYIKQKLLRPKRRINDNALTPSCKEKWRWGNNPGKNFHFGIKFGKWMFGQITSDKISGKRSTIMLTSAGFISGSNDKVH